MFSTSYIKATTETLQTLLNALPTPMFLIDREHRLVLVNDAFCVMAGRTPEELVNRTDYPVPDEQKAEFFRVDDEVFSTGHPNENEELTTTANGDVRIILTRKRLVHLQTEEGEQPFILASTTDVTRFREAEARAKHLAEHDPLTGLANRSRLTACISKTIEAAAKADRRAALLLIDLDGFKAINDQHGHPAGDRVLQIVAKRLLALARPVDTVARIGGDEFCVVQTDGQQPAAAFSLAERVMSSFAQPVTLGKRHMFMGASIGIAVFPDEGATPEVLMHRADEALYDVKRAGRRGYLRYEGNRGTCVSEHCDVEFDPGVALAADQLSLAFQPLSSASDGQIRGFEALARWNHPDLGPIEPDRFITAAESSGLIHQLGFWALHKACAEAAKWPRPLRVSVNISASQLQSGNLASTVAMALSAANLPAERLELELAETALTGESEHVAKSLSELKALGVSLALDGFGSGWSSLATLQRFQFDRIKVDRTFISNIEHNPRSAAIVRAVLSLAKSLDVPVTAEGIESQSQLTAARRMGFDELQGFYIGKPLSEAIFSTSPDIKCAQSGYSGDSARKSPTTTAV